MNTIEINILEDFGEYTGIRHCSLSDYSGEDFYHKILNKKFKEALDEKKKLIIKLDYTAGYAPSFLDESFGNLVYDFGEETVKKNIEIISNEDPYWIEMLEKETYPQWEKRRQKKDAPKITGDHKPWWRKDNDGKFAKKNWVEKHK